MTGLSYGKIHKELCLSDTILQARKATYFCVWLKLSSKIGSTFQKPITTWELFASDPNRILKESKRKFIFNHNIPRMALQSHVQVAFHLFCILYERTVIFAIPDKNVYAQSDGMQLLFKRFGSRRSGKTVWSSF